MTASSYGRVLTHLAEEEPDRLALVCDDGSLTRIEFERRANRLARAYAERGVREGDFVTLGLPNGLELCCACMATWKLGAVPNPVSSHLPLPELAGIVEHANPSLVVGFEEGMLEGRLALPPGFEPDPGLSDAVLPDRIPPHERAMASSGSTGRPKLIVPRSPGLYDPETASHLFKPKRANLVPGPLYHPAPFSAAWQGLFAGSTVVIMTRFDASRCLELIERYRVDRMFVVPTMMQRIWRLPEQERLARDVSSLEFVLTGGAPCPPWLMRAWIEWLGPETMAEAFGPSERIGGTFITGTEWLAHPGSVGKPIVASFKILDPEGNECPPGQMGEIWCIPAGGPGSTYRYVGAEGRKNEDGWESVGDMGYLDEEGYLYLGDRQTDMILSAGRNIYPAEVEAALDAHPAVRSSAVIGLPDEDVGQRIHAIVECDGEIDDEELRQHLKELLVYYKVPRSFEYVGDPLRDDAGKIRRFALREERIARGASDS